MEHLNVEFTNEDVCSSTAHGKLWLIHKIGCGGKWGILRLRRGRREGMLVADGNLVWKKPWARFNDPVVPGKLIYSTPAGNHVLIDLHPSNATTMGVNPD